MGEKSDSLGKREGEGKGERGKKVTLWVNLSSLPVTSGSLTPKPGWVPPQAQNQGEFPPQTPLSATGWLLPGYPGVRKERSQPGMFPSLSRALTPEEDPVPCLAVWLL